LLNVERVLSKNETMHSRLVKTKQRARARTWFCVATQQKLKLLSSNNACLGRLCPEQPSTSLLLEQLLLAALKSFCIASSYFVSLNPVVLLICRHCLR